MVKIQKDQEQNDKMILLPGVQSIIDTMYKMKNIDIIDLNF